MLTWQNSSFDCASPCKIFHAASFYVHVCKRSSLVVVVNSIHQPCLSVETSLDIYTSLVVQSPLGNMQRQYSDKAIALLDQLTICQ